MNDFKIESNDKSVKFKYALMFNNKCLACFSNKRQAIKMLNFLKWYEKRFNYHFISIEQCAFQLHHSISNANLVINYETIY
jgi:hypothetical protein